MSFPMDTIGGRLLSSKQMITVAKGITIIERELFDRYHDQVRIPMTYDLPELSVEDDEPTQEDILIGIMGEALTAIDGLHVQAGAAWIAFILVGIFTVLREFI